MKFKLTISGHEYEGAPAKKPVSVIAGPLEGAALVMAVAEGLATSAAHTGMTMRLDIEVVEGTTPPTGGGK